LDPRTKAKIKLPIPEQYGITKVPSTVPSTPLALMTSRRQIITNEATINIARKHQGAHSPVLSIAVTNDFNRRS
jgi:hypothetical protein